MQPANVKAPYTHTPYPKNQWQTNTETKMLMTDTQLAIPEPLRKRPCSFLLSIFLINIRVVMSSEVLTRNTLAPPATARMLLRR